MIRIGITQRVEDLPDRGERRDCLDQAWTPLFESIGLLPIAIPNRAGSVRSFVTELGLAGVVLSGGNDLADLPEPSAPAPERDACEREILALSGETGLPVLGVCRGLQIIASYYGAPLTRVEGHVATRHALDSEGGGPLALEPRELVNSFHGWGVLKDALPADLRAAATAPDGTVEALYHLRYAQAAIMWHPERDPCDPRDAKLIRSFFEGAR
jgi:putative glutamine amidotransferase